MSVKKLIEVALPLDKINKECAREKSIRHGHPSTLHLWWARRPLAAARAVIWSSLVDDPSSHPEKFPTEDEQNNERNRLFKILEDLVVWENSNDERVLNAAKAEIMKSTNDNPPPLLDPFAGGGAIPLEAYRLGLETYAHDLNPIAVMINKAMIEIPGQFVNASPVNPEYQNRILNTKICSNALSISEDIQYYGKMLINLANKKVGHLYPQIDLPKKFGGGKATVIAWIWARTVECPNPSCSSKIPLTSTFVLTKKKGKEAYLDYYYDGESFVFDVKYGNIPKEKEKGTKYANGKGKGKKGTFCCPICNTIVKGSDYIDYEANSGRMHAIPMAVVVEGKQGRVYLPVNRVWMDNQIEMINEYYSSNDVENIVPNAKCRGTFASNAQGGFYGFKEFKDYFTKRQLCTLTTLTSLIPQIQQQITEDAIQAGMNNSPESLSEGGSGAKAYGQAISVYLAFCIDKLSDYNSSLCSWQTTRDGVRCTFGRQAIPMVWDFTEANPFSNSSGCWNNMLEWVTKSVANLPMNNTFGHAEQFDAQSDCRLRNIMVSTDPPYYDNICYSNLSDFFYVWIRKSLRQTYPSIFKTMLVPKAEELIASPYRYDGNIEKARNFFEDGMLKTCQQIYNYSREDIPVTIYYAYKQSETNDVEGKVKTASTGWEVMLNAIIHSNFIITGTWPIRTELANRSVGIGTNALSSSIVLVCRKRPGNAPQTTRRNLINALKRELRPALKKLQDSNIAPVDLAQSAIGPGMAVFSRYSQVLEADGSPMTVRNALQVINEEIDFYFNEQVGSLDTSSRFCVDVFTQCAYNDIKFGEAEVLANAKGASIPKMVNAGILFAKSGNVHLLERCELPEKVNKEEKNIWLLTQQLTRAMEKGGIETCAQIIYEMPGSNTEDAKELAYRLFTISDRKKWTVEAYAYNALVVAWPDIQSRAAELNAMKPVQVSMFD